MEQRRRSGKREHQSRAGASGDHHRSGRHGRPSGESQIENDGSKVQSRHDRTHGQLTKEYLSMPSMSGDDDYVRRWLAQTDKDVKLDAAHSRTPMGTSNNKDLDRNAPRDITSFPYVPPDNQVPDTRGKRRRYSSSDSSLLEMPTKHKAEVLNREQNVPPALKVRETSIPLRRKRKAESSSSASEREDHSALQTSPKEVFEKRTRHKTREDLYEPNEKYISSKKDSEEKPRRKRKEKKSGQRKAAKKAGEDLMHNFSSKSIGQDRLTMRPSHGPGLFKNGRASSPARRRGLPDLAFSEMEFLQRHTHQASSTKVDKIKSESRGKEKWKSSRAQEEISTFFKLNKTPLKEMNLNRADRRTSAYAGDESSIFGKQSAGDWDQLGHSLSRPFDHLDKPYLGFGRPGPSSDRISASRGLTPASNYPNNVPESLSRLSGRATSDVTWSEIQFSPRATASPQRLADADRRRAPDSDRRSTEITGIFRDTGIGATPESRMIEVDQSSRTDRSRRFNDAHGRVGSRNEAFQEMISREIASSKVSEGLARRSDSSEVQRQERPRGIDRNSHRRETVTEQDERRNNNRSREVEEEIASGQKHVIIEYCDRESGWHQRSSSQVRNGRSPTATIGADTPNEPEPTNQTLSREEIAKKARVKRPRTNLPATKETHRESGGSPSMKPAMETPGAREIASQAPTGGTQDLRSRNTEHGDEGKEFRNAEHKGDSTRSSCDTQQHTDEKNADKQSHRGIASTDAESVQNPTLEKPSAVPTPPTSATLNTIGREIGRVDSRSALGLSLRGSWIGHGSVPIIRRTQLSPILEVEPYFLHQMRQQPRYGEDQTQYIVDHGQVISGNNLGFNAEDISLAQDIPQDILDCQRGVDFDAQDSNYVEEVVLYEDFEEFEDSYTYQPVGAEIWQPEEQDFHIQQEIYDGWDGQDERAYRLYGMVEDPGVGQNSEQRYTPLEQGNYFRHTSYEEGEVMPGFWMSYRQY